MKNNLGMRLSHSRYQQHHREIFLETMMTPEDHLLAAVLATIDESRKRSNTASARYSFRVCGLYKESAPRTPDNFAIVKVLAVKARDGHTTDVMPESISLTREQLGNFQVM